MDVLPTSQIFLYPHFTTGRVFLRDGTVAEVKLNYSRLVDEIHFIDQNGDTLALDNESNLKYVVAGNDTFYYNEGYLRILASGSSAKLGVRDIWIISDTRPVGAYNTTNTTVSMLSFKSINEGGRLYDLVVNEDVIFKKMAKYYFADNFNNFLQATKANLLMLFPKEQQAINIYLRENKINLNDKEDLEKTVQFVNQLSQK